MWLQLFHFFQGNIMLTMFGAYALALVDCWLLEMKTVILECGLLISQIVSWSVDWMVLSLAFWQLVPNQCCHTSLVIVYVQNFQPVICSIYNDCGNSLTCSYKTGSLCDLITSFCRILLIKCSSVCTGMCNMCIASTHTVSLSPLLIQCTEFLLGTKNWIVK